MNVLIIEDETLSANRLRDLIRKYDPGIKVVGRLSSVKESIKWLEDVSHVKPDLIFMDLHLEDDLAFKIIDHLNLAIPIIFTTAYSEYALKAFKANSVDYLLKPINSTELASALDKFSRLKSPSFMAPELAALVSHYQAHIPQAYKERFLASAGNNVFSIKTVDIAYFTIEQKATFLKTFSGQHLSMDSSLDRLGELLDPKAFFRVNRHLIVSHASIQAMHALTSGKLKLELSPSLRDDVFVSGDRMSAFKIWLGK
jgi:DNA-binding LytR/AlgR family response regulator